jgi:outer membrane protein OmpA-like peptidoglycan-associated protein
MIRRIGTLAVAAICALAIACSPPPKTGEMISFEQMRQEEYAKTVQIRFPKLFNQADKLYRRAVEEHDDSEPEAAEHYTRMATIVWRTAVSLSRKKDAEDSLRAAANRLKIADAELSEAERRRDIARDAIARMERLREMQRKLAEAEAQATEQRRAKNAKAAINAAMLELQKAEGLDAARHAPGELNKAQTSFQQAMDLLNSGDYPKAEQAGKVALADIAAVVAVAEPLYAAEQKQREIDAMMQSLFEAAGGVPGAEPRIDQRGVVVSLRGLFASGKTEVNPEKHFALDQAAELATKFPRFRIIVEGHTDNRGSGSKNLVLSEARAQAVGSYISSKGVDPGRMASIGRGDEDPIADNATRDGRAQNRRVDMVFQRPQVE